MSPRALLHDIRALWRSTAQPVVVITARIPRQHVADPLANFHGATLSSFSSIAFDPHPLVAFSLRVPSRMASFLQVSDPNIPSHMVINILSAAQASTANTFARADLYPHPFTSCSYSLSPDGLPILHDSLSAISCKLVTPPWPLHDLGALDRKNFGLRPELERTPWDGEGVASELFIARIIRVEQVPHSDVDESMRTLPLLYHRRGYTTVHPISSPTKK